MQLLVNTNILILNYDVKADRHSQIYNAQCKQLTTSGIKYSKRRANLLLIANVNLNAKKRET